MTPGHLESEIWNHQVLGHRPRHIFTITFSLTDQISNMHNLSPSCQGCHEQHIVLISERASFKSSQPRPVFPFPSASSRWQVFHRVNIQDPEVFREHFSFSGQSDNTFISFVCWRGQQRGYGVSFLWDGRPSRFVVVSVIAGMDFVVGRGRGLCCNLSSSSQRNDETVFGRAFQSTVHTKLDTQPGQHNSVVHIDRVSIYSCSLRNQKSISGSPSHFNNVTSFTFGPFRSLAVTERSDKHRTRHNSTFLGQLSDALAHITSPRF
eukprot:c19472_g1_i1.p1 GENE.c19472_g1_i1~~c19472_g1_i1.p1  ORF type:complete len:264 (+),score=18.02 c19472_g1_i1:301-1092(+)